MEIVDGIGLLIAIAALGGGIDWIESRVDLTRQRARKLRLENDRLELENKDREP